MSHVEPEHNRPQEGQECTCDHSASDVIVDPSCPVHGNDEGYAPNRCEKHGTKYFSVCPDCTDQIHVTPARPCLRDTKCDEVIDTMQLLVRIRDCMKRWSARYARSAHSKKHVAETRLLMQEIDELLEKFPRHTKD